MTTTTFNTHLVTVPFGINGIEYYNEAVDPANPWVLGHRSYDQPPSPAGAARGVMQLRTQQQQSTATPSIGTEPPLHVMSMHQKGRLLVWNADTLEVIGTCDLRGCSVVQCVVTPNYMYTRVESSSEQGSEEDWKIFVWDIKTFDLSLQLASHQGRVTHVVVCDQNELCVATASVDHSIHLWDLSKDTVSPVQKLNNLGSATLLMYFNGIVLGGCSDTPFMAWNGKTGAELCKPSKTSGEGATTVARWLKDYGPNGKKVTGRSSQYRLLSGDSDGFVKLWLIDTPSMPNSKLSLSLKWARKTHRGPLKELCGDSEVVLSYSLLDGACLSLSENGKIAPLVDCSVRTAVLDTYSKSVIIGAEDGCVLIMKYDSWLKEGNLPDLYSSFYPHVSSITGLLLQLSADKSWNRLICSGADGSIALLDFTKQRNGRSVNGLGSEVLDYVPFCKSFFISNTFGGMAALNSVDMLPYNVQPEIRHRVTALRWVESTRTLIVGSEEGAIIFYEISIGEDRSPVFYKIGWQSVSSYHPCNFVSSESGGSLVLASMQKNGVFYEGGFLVINTKESDVASPLRPVENIRYEGGTIITLTDYEMYDYTIFVQLQNGSVVQYAGHLSTNSLPVFLRTLVEPLHSGALLGPSAPTRSPSTVAVFASVTSSGATTVQLTFADGAEMTQMSFEAVTGSPMERVEFGKRNESTHLNGTEAVVQLLPMMEYIVVVRNSPDVDVVSQSGEYLYRIAYCGDVMNYRVMGQRRRSRSYPLHSAPLGSSTNHQNDPFACKANFCEERRYLAIGYRDGVVQLFDLSQKVIFMRFTSHSENVSSLWAFPDVVISSTPNSACRADFVLRRAMFDIKEGSVTSQSLPISQSYTNEHSTMSYPSLLSQ